VKSDFSLINTLANMRYKLTHLDTIIFLKICYNICGLFFKRQDESVLFLPMFFTDNGFTFNLGFYYVSFFDFRSFYKILSKYRPTIRKI
jgi:hypothetical protein